MWAWISNKSNNQLKQFVAQYASDCSGNADYLEMDKAFKTALNMCYMYQLREEDWIASTYGIYLSEAVEELEHEIEEGQNAQDILNKLNKQYGA